MEWGRHDSEPGDRDSNPAVRWIIEYSNPAVCWITEYSNPVLCWIIEYSNLAMADRRPMECPEDFQNGYSKGWTSCSAIVGNRAARWFEDGVGDTISSPSGVWEVKSR